MSKTQYGLVLLVAIVAGLIGGAISSRLFLPKIIRAQRFEVVRQGKSLAVLDRNGLVLSADRGWVAALHAEGGPALMLYDGSQQTRAVLSAAAPNLTLYNENNKRRADLALWPKGEPHLRFYDREGGVSWAVPERGEAP